MNYLSKKERTIIGALTIMNLIKAPVSAKQLTQLYNLHKRYLENGLQTLCRAKIIRGHRGPHGGYMLAVNAKRLTIKRLLMLLNKTTESRTSKSIISDNNICRIIDENIALVLADITIEDLTKKLSPKDTQILDQELSPRID